MNEKELKELIKCYKDDELIKKMLSIIEKQKGEIKSLEDKIEYYVEVLKILQENTL